MNKNGKYTPQQITDMLYSYMVERQTAAYVCENILHMSREKIGNPRQAWRNLEHYYHSYGFRKRYNNGMAFRRITKDKLSQYVRMYWEKAATEKDLIEFFPEILNDLNEAKKIEGERVVSMSEVTGRNYTNYNNNSNNSNSCYEWHEPPKTQQVKNTLQRKMSQGKTISEKSNKNNRKSSYTGNFGVRTSNDNNYDNLKNNTGYPSNTNSDDAVGILGVLAFIIIAIIIWKTGIFSTIGHGIAGLFGKIFWLLELIFFYGGIILFIISLIRKRLSFVWKSCIGFSLLGLGFGCMSEGRFVTAIVLGIIGVLFINAKQRY